MIIGIDVGLTNIHVSGIRNDILIHKEIIQKSNEFELENYLELLSKKYEIKQIFYSGDKKFYVQSFKEFKIIKKNEIDSIGKGGLFLANVKEGIVCSCGTGTCIVKGNSTFKHMGGSSIGGGTLVGLSKLLLGTTNIEKIKKLAESGNISNIDFVLSDISKEDIGFLNKDSSISHFGKIKTQKNEDLAAAIINMIGQNIANLNVIAAKGEELSKIILVGKVLDIPLIQEIIKNRVRLMSKNIDIIIPENYEFATSIGTTK